MEWGGPRSAHGSPRRAARAIFALAALLVAGLPATPIQSQAAISATTAGPAGSQFQSDPAHTGVQTGTGITPPLRGRWHVAMPQHPSYAIVGGGHVFVTYNLDFTHEALVALNESNGSTYFGPISLGPENTGHYAGLAYDGGRVFTNTASCLIDAVDANTGAVAWQNQLNDSDCAGPLAASGGT